MTDDADRVAVARRAASAGAQLARDHFRTDITVETKGEKTDVVTEADRAGQRRIIEVVRESFPRDAIVGEEEDELKAVPDTGAAWVIDPIDGTSNFVRDLRLWTTSVAAVEDGEPVAAANACPALGDTYVADGEGTYRNGEPVWVSTESDPEGCTVVPTIWWDFAHREEYAAATTAIVDRFGDMRRFGSAQLTLSLLADGAIDGAITNVRANPWDTVAGVFMIRQAGGTVTDLDGNRWRHDSRGLVASNGEIHDEVLAAAREIHEAD